MSRETRKPRPPSGGGPAERSEGEPPGRPHRRRAIRVALGVLAALAAIEVAYLAIGNLLIATPLLERLLERKPEKRRIEWDRAWTVVPGRVHLRGFRLRVQNRPAQWLLTLDRATATIDLPALTGRGFHLTALDADGASLRLRRRLDTRPDADVAPEAAPPIPGLANPPERPPEELYERPEGAGWRIALDRVAVTGVREIWIDEHRLTGDGELTGSLELHVRRSLAIEDARLRLVGATLHRSDAEVADRLDADLEARLDRLDPTEHRGREKLRFLSARLDLEGRVVDLGALIEPPGRDTGDGRWLRLGGEGDLAAQVEVEQGVLAAGSRLAVDAPTLAVDYLGYRAEGSGRLTAQVAGADDPAGDGDPALGDGVETAAGVENGAAALPAHLLARLDRFSVRAPGAAEPHVEGSGFALSVRAAPPDLAGPPPPAEIEIVLPRSRVPDLTVYDAYLPRGSGLALVAGQGEIGGRLRYSTAEGAGRAEVELTATGASARYRGLPLSGDLRIAARVPAFDPHERRFDLAGTEAELTRVSAGDGDAGWWGRFELPEGTIDLEEGRLDARFTGRARDSGPVVALFATRHRALDWFDRLLTVEDLAASGHLGAGRERLEVRDLRIGNDRLSIEGRMHLAGGSHRGVYLARLGRLSAAVAASGDERDWKLLRSREWYLERVRSMPAD